MPPAKPYDNPRLYSDTVSLITMLIKKHKGMDRTFRILFMEQKIYPLLTSVMEDSLKMQFASHPEKKSQIDMFDKMRVSLEIVKSYLTICFESKQISQTFYLQVYRKTEEISKQALGWKNHTLSSHKKEK
jgi:hypothetical protein